MGFSKQLLFTWRWRQMCLLHYFWPLSVVDRHITRHKVAPNWNIVHFVRVHQIVGLFSHSCFGNEKERERERDKHADRQTYISRNKLTEYNTKYITSPAPAKKIWKTLQETRLKVTGANFAEFSVSPLSAWPGQKWN